MEMRQTARRTNVVRAASPEYSYTRAPMGGQQPTSSNSMNWLLIVIVLILVPGNIFVFWGSGGK